jgi:spermidine synthase
MDPEQQVLRRDRAITALVPLFLASGATSLIYQSLWARHLHLVVGTSAVAIAIVLAAFMAGLAAGGFAAGRLVDRVARPLQVYGIIEALIGIWALLFPLLLSAVEPLYLGFWRAFEPTPLAFAGFQFALLGLLLLPPTACMGATLPLLARFAATDGRETGDRVGRLYGANTLGAVLGTALAGFYLLPALGLEATNHLAAAANLALGAVAIGLGRTVAPLAPEPVSADSRRLSVALAGLAAVAGLSSLLYEVAFFRLLVLTLGGSAYAFTVMLLGFLLGIGLGGWGGGRLADRAWARGGLVRTLGLLAALQIGVALTMRGSSYAWSELHFVFVWMYVQISGNTGWLWPGKLMLALAVMLPPTLLMGASFPVLVRAAAGGGTQVGGPVGRLYGWNTLGAIFGAAVGGLILLPLLRVEGTVMLGIGLNLVGAWMAWAQAQGVAPEAAAAGTPARPAHRRASLPVLGVGLAAVGLGSLLLWWGRPTWDPMVMTAGMYKYVSDLEPEDRNRAGVLAFAVEPYDLLYYEEGLGSVVTVARARETGNMWMANNGKVDASTRIDMPTQLMVAHLPFVFAEDARDVLVIGLASGITAGSVTTHQTPERIEIVELEPAVVRGSHLFDEFNHRPLADPRVTLTANDARNRITLAEDGTWDVVVAEPSNPWQTGVSNLFTAEFFALGRRKLKPGGVWSQWVQMYGMDEGDLKSLLGTFADAYPYVQLFSTIEDADLVLLGSEQPLDLDVAQVARLFQREPKVVADLHEIQVDVPEDVLTRWQIGREGILRFAGDTVRNTDDNMRVEYSAPLHLHDDSANANFLSLLGSTGARNAIPVNATDGGEGLLALARAYERRKDLVRALITLKEAERVEPGLPEVERLYVEYQGRLLTALDESEERKRGRR